MPARLSLASVCWQEPQSGSLSRRGEYLSHEVNVKDDGLLDMNCWFKNEIDAETGDSISSPE